MALLTKYDPFHEVLSLRDAMNLLFEQSVVSPTWWRTGARVFGAPVDAYETEQGYQVTVLVPGIKPEDIDISVQQHQLSIKGQYPAFLEDEKQVNWLVHEIGSGSFERTITFDRPIDPDKVETHYEYGVLTISLPVSEASRPRRISITGPAEQLAEAGASR
ncbi:MAG TPA: Hsp20/alpha crystallin family protein [Ktedonobacteraceae bacterium]|nr:Hsp20/alpha crystallin family protein [Ktedonobacteraceae bacterium]